MDFKRYLKQRSALKTATERTNAEQNWQSGADFCNPPNSDITKISAKGNRKSVARVTDVGIKARRKFASNLYGYKIGGSRFFDYRLKKRELSDNENVKRWLTDVNNITYSELMSSNFPSQVYQGYGELSYIGTTIMFIEDGGDRALNFKTQNIARTYIDVNSKGLVDTVFMDLPFTARQIEQEFPDATLPEKVKRALDNASQEEFCVIHAVVENTDYVKGSLNPKKRKWAGLYLLQTDGEEPELLRQDGYDEFPCAVGRLHRTHGEIYGRGCFSEVWSSLQLNNDQNVTLIRSAQLKAEPDFLEPAGSNMRRIRSHGMSKIIYDPTATFGAKPEQLVVNNDVGVTDLMLQKTEAEILEGFFVNAFNPLADQRNMTATETMERIDLGLSEVSPLLYNTREYDNATMHRVFGILYRAGKYPEIPAELDRMDTADIIDIEYTSKAALALRQLQLYGVNSTIEQIGLIGQINPAIWDNFDGDAYARFAAETNNVPNEILKPSKEVEKERAARAKAEQQQQMVNNAPMMADAANKLSKPVEPNSPLEAMINQ
jgi:hypothetical protein